MAERTRDPEEIWEESVAEGGRRIRRGIAGLASTGLIGGVDVMLGIIALTVVTGALETAVPYPVAHIGGSMAFGIGFVLIVIGRSELFTENFLVPVAAVLRDRQGIPLLFRLWGATLLANLVGLFIVAAMCVRAGVLDASALHAAGTLADTYTQRDAISALLSAIIAGTVMTLFTWLALAVELGISRIAIALLLGFLLAAPSLNHAVVSFGEISFGLLAGTADGNYLDLLRNLGIAIVGNVIGGLGYVTLARAVQVRGEPDG